MISNLVLKVRILYIKNWTQLFSECILSLRADSFGGAAGGGGRGKRYLPTSFFSLLAAQLGFEPRFHAPEARVLPLDDRASFG